MQINQLKLNQLTPVASTHYQDKFCLGVEEYRLCLDNAIRRYPLSQTVRYFNSVVEAEDYLASIQVRNLKVIASCKKKGKFYIADGADGIGGVIFLLKDGTFGDGDPYIAPPILYFNTKEEAEKKLAELQTKQKPEEVKPKICAFDHLEVFCSIPDKFFLSGNGFTLLNDDTLFSSSRANHANIQYFNSHGEAEKKRESLADIKKCRVIPHANGTFFIVSRKNGFTLKKDGTFSYGSNDESTQFFESEFIANLYFEALQHGFKLKDPNSSNRNIAFDDEISISCDANGWYARNNATSPFTYLSPDSQFTTQWNSNYYTKTLQELLDRLKLYKRKPIIILDRERLSNFEVCRDPGGAGFFLQCDNQCVRIDGSLDDKEDKLFFNQRDSAYAYIKLARIGLKPSHMLPLVFAEFGGFIICYDHRAGARWYAKKVRLKEDQPAYLEFKNNRLDILCRDEPNFFVDHPKTMMDCITSYNDSKVVDTFAPKPTTVSKTNTPLINKLFGWWA